MDGLPKPLFLSTKSCLFVDRLIRIHLSSMKTALFVDEARDPRSPSTKHALFVDRRRKNAGSSTKLPPFVDGTLVKDGRTILAGKVLPELWGPGEEVA